MDGLQRWSVLRLHIEDEIRLTALARDAGVGLRTLQRWHRLYKGGRQAGAPAPEYATVRAIVRSLDPAMVTLALEGPAAYHDRHELVFRRRAERPNATWQADHTELDILIVGADGKREWPWLTVVMDDYSRAICGYMVFTGAPSAMNTALALRQAIWRKSDPSWAMCCGWWGERLSRSRPVKGTVS